MDIKTRKRAYYPEYTFYTFASHNKKYSIAFVNGVLTCVSVLERRTNV